MQEFTIEFRNRAIQLGRPLKPTNDDEILGGLALSN